MIRNWAFYIRGKARFIDETLIQIREGVQKSNNVVYACLIFDKMALKRQIDFDGKEGMKRACCYYFFYYII